MTKEKKPKTQPIKPVGRPTKYDLKYCQMLIDHMASGLSYESFAGVIGTFRATLYNWEKSHEDFLDAKKEGSEKNLLFWEKAGHEGLWDETEYNEHGKPIYKKSLNSTVWIFSMKNRHKWKDRQDIEMSADVNINPLKEDLKKMSTEDLLDLAKVNNDHTP